MPFRSAPLKSWRPRTVHGGRAVALVCAISVLPVAQAVLPDAYRPLPSAWAQILPDAATQELFLAVDRNDLDGVRAAIDKGADLEARDFTGTQPVDMAIDRGYFEIARYLISVRNLRQDTQQPIPDFPELAAEPPAPDASSTQPAEQLAETPPPEPGPQAAEPPPPAPAPMEPVAEDDTIPDPFETAEAAESLPVLGEIQEPETAGTELDELDTLLDAAETPPAGETDPLDALLGEAAPAAPETTQSVADELDALLGAVETPPTHTSAPPEGEIDPLDALLGEAENAAPAAPEPPAPPMALEPDPQSENLPGTEATPETADLPSPPEPPSDMADAMSDFSIGDAQDDVEGAAEETAPTDMADAMSDFVIEDEDDDEAELELNVGNTDTFEAPDTSPDTAPNTTQAAAEAAPSAPEKPSAARRFMSTFLDFFKPPNVTGVVRREEDRQVSTGVVSEAELARELQELEAERGSDAIRGPDVPISPDELARELPPAPELPDLPAEELAALSPDSPALPEYNVGQPAGVGQTAGQDAFGDLAIEDATEEDALPIVSRELLTNKPAFKEAPGVPGKRYDPNKPFGGGVDPDILAFLDLDARTGMTDSERDEILEGPKAIADSGGADVENDPFAVLDDVANDDPFAVADEPAANVSDLLEGLDEPQDVAALDAKTAPSRAAEDDPFAAPPASDDPFAAPAEGEVDELAGLLEGLDDPDTSGAEGWDVKKVEGADIPSEMILLSEIEPTGKILDGVELSLGLETKVGQEMSAHRLELMELDTIHRPCLSKGAKDTLFCVDKLSWPFELEDDFLVDTIMYQGTRAIARYDAGRATNFHTLFRTEAFDKVINYYTQRYGHPTEMVERAIAPLAAPRQENPTYLWQSREPGTDTIVTLEIRKFDDAQGGGFPDTNRGVILLYKAHAKPIFPQLSQLELMVLKADDDISTSSASADGLGGEIQGEGDDLGRTRASPDSIW